MQVLDLEYGAEVWAPLELVLRKCLLGDGKGISIYLNNQKTRAGKLLNYCFPHPSIIWSELLAVYSAFQNHGSWLTMCFQYSMAFRRKKDHGRAEALLIAWWGAKKSMGFLTEPAETQNTTSEVINMDHDQTNLCAANEDESEVNLNKLCSPTPCECEVVDSTKDMSSINASQDMSLSDSSNRSRVACDEEISIPRNPMFVIEERNFENCEDVLNAGLALNKRQVCMQWLMFLPRFTMIWNYALVKPSPFNRF